MYKIFRNALFLLDAEKAHYTAMSALSMAGKIGMGPLIKSMFDVAEQPVEFAGLRFKNNIGLAAGFDKNARWIKELSWLGFGHLEVGTVTPKPQSGNDRPRLFRLKDDEALINRMGFNNDGVVEMVQRLKSVDSAIIIGGNIGKNKTTPNEQADEDYLSCFEALYEHVNYFTVNVSSPNTPGLRSLQEKEPLKKLLKKLIDRRTEMTKQKDLIRKPIFLKIAPDLTNTQLDEIIEIADELSLDGIVATNTTIQREGLKSAPGLINEAGGLSGKPVEKRSNEVIEYLSKQTAGKLPIIGVGGVFNADDYKRKLDAGAALVQVYTGFIYQGPGLVKQLLAN